METTIFVLLTSLCSRGEHQRVNNEPLVKMYNGKYACRAIGYYLVFLYACMSMYEYINMYTLNAAIEAALTSHHCSQ